MNKTEVKKKTTLSQTLGMIAGVIGVIFHVILFFILMMFVGIISFLNESGLFIIIFLFSIIGFISSIIGIIATDFENKKKSGWTMIVCGIIISMYIIINIKLSFLLISGILFIIAGIIKLKEK
jgi:uncharacterized membrane protein HdeD (DUF308 family)